MKIDRADVEYVAALANLALDGEEMDRMARDLGEILAHMTVLNDLDTSNVEPMTQVLYEAEDGLALRDDEPRPVLGSDAAVANAAAAGSGYFKVPKVIER